MEEYVTGRKASEILGVHQRTLYQWEKKKWIETIRTPGNKRLYNVKKYLKSKEINIDTITENNININIKKNIIYGRVSSLGQKNDLERQINVLKNKYPTY
jgi:putative resolvase